MRDGKGRGALRQLRQVLESFLLNGTSALSAILTAKEVLELIGHEVVDRGERVFTPLVTLCLFLRQIHSDDGSCRAAVAQFNAERVAQGQPPCSPLTGGYCKARQRLPERLIKRVVMMSGRRLEQQTPMDWRWQGRVVKVVDGSSVSRPDTPANQRAYPQPGRQRAGCGFPTARVVVILSLTCGAVIAGAVGRLKGKRTGELALFDSLHETFSPGEVALADRYYCSYWEVALLGERGVDVVMRLHASRHVDFRRGQRLGRYDHRVSWSKPARPRWLDKARYEALPERITMRELRVSVTRPGFRTRSLVIVTTLLDAETFTNKAIAERYRARWQAELDLRSIKQTMNMDVLRCKSPEMVRQELWAHLLVYNFLRAAMAQAARHHGQLLPRQISLQGTRQTLNGFRGLLVQQTSTHSRQAIIDIVLDAIAAHRVGNRPDRYEPRVRKRRPKPYPLMTVPRQQARQRLATAA